MMNEFNPFKELWIDPNKDQQNITPLDTQTQVNPMETAWQFNPFKELWINPNKDTTELLKPNKDTEVTSMLDLESLTPMTDNEKQSYVNSLSDEDWNTWNKLKEEWYSFEARKALLDNRYDLYDINQSWTLKYRQTQPPITSTWGQRFIDVYQQRIAWSWERFRERTLDLVNYKKDWSERDWFGSWLLKTIWNLATNLVANGRNIGEDVMNLLAHWVETKSTLKFLQGKTDQIAIMNRDLDTYESPLKSITWMATAWLDTAVTIKFLIPSIIIWTIAEGDNPLSKLVNWWTEKFSEALHILPENWVEFIHEQLMKIPQVQEWINEPWNAWIKEDLIESLVHVEELLLMRFMDAKGKKLSETKRRIAEKQIGDKINKAVEEWIWKVKESTGIDIMETWLDFGSWLARKRWWLLWRWLSWTLDKLKEMYQNNKKNKAEAPIEEATVIETIPEPKPEAKVEKKTTKKNKQESIQEQPIEQPIEKPIEQSKPIEEPRIESKPEIKEVKEIEEVKSDITPEELNQIKEAASYDLKNIRIDENWEVVWNRHGHTDNVYSYIEDSNLPEGLKNKLKQQSEAAMQRQDARILERLGEPLEEYYYNGSDVDYSMVNMNKMKGDVNWLWYPVNKMADNAYSNKPFQKKYTRNNLNIAPEWTTLTLDKLTKVCKELGIEVNEARADFVPLAELSQFLKDEVPHLSNKKILDTLVKETGYDGVSTSHNYDLIWNEKKINNNLVK